MLNDPHNSIAPVSSPNDPLVPVPALNSIYHPSLQKLHVPQGLSP